PETKYLVGRFLRRHRAGAAATLVALVSIFVALAISTTLYLGESEARRAAILETEKSRLTATFLGEILTTAGPAHTMGRDSTMMRELLVEASERLELQLRDAPEIQARLRVVIGATFNELHEYEAANSELGKALAFYRETPPTDKTKLARCLTEYGDALENIVDYERAEPILREALSIWIAEVGPNDPQTGNVQGKLAFLLAKAGRMEEAEPFASAAVALWRSDPANELLQDTIPAMGVLLKRTGRKEESLALYREELEVLRSLHPNGHPDLANCLDNLGWTLENLGRDEEAMPVLLEALEVGRHFYGDHCPHEDHVLAALSRIEGRRGDLEKQLQYAREASEVGARVFPSGHRYRRESQSVYANVLLAQAEMWLDRIHSAAKSDAEKKHALESAEERLSVLGEMVEREKLSHLDLRWIGFLNAVAAAGDAAPESVRDAYRRWLEQGTPLTSMKNRKEKAERFLSMVE
ncbi:MAG: tetratricopeptide repeat protein, partial [Verrucomicrobiota bacterium]